MDRLPHVLVSGVVLSQPMGGVRRHNQELLARAARILVGNGGSLRLLLGRDGLPFELPPEVELLPSDVPAGPPLLRARAERGALLERLSQRGERPVELVHTAHLPAPERLPVPYTLTLHDLRTLALRHTPFSRRFFASAVIGRAVRRAACTIAVSAWMQEELITRFAPRRTALVPNAGDHFAPIERSPEPDFLLHLGHVEPRKNLALLLHALAAEPGLPDLTLAGASKGETAKDLMRLASELGVGQRVRFLGAVPDAALPELLAGAACLVLPSRLEGFGIPVLEAQLARCPLAVSNAGALPEVAGPDVPTFDPDDAAGCATAIQRALRTPSEVLAAHAERATRFRWEASAQALVEAWKEAVVPPPA